MMSGGAIMIIDLSRQELVLLQQVVRQYYMNLRAEIYHTEAADFKKGLKDEEAQIQRLLEKIETKLIAQDEV
jgi:hypothetical protein